MTASQIEASPRSPSQTPLRFAVIGGDRRMAYVARRLAEAGHAVSLLGCGTDCFSEDKFLHEGNDPPVRRFHSLERAAERADVITLPLPATRDGKTVWCPRDHDCTVTFDALRDLLCLRPDLCLFGGRLSDGFAAGIPAHLHTGNARVIDYYEDEALQLRNAYLTAEAAVMTAMQLSDHALRGSEAAIIGYGRIGKMLARLLLSLGVDVTVCARREEALLWAEADGCHPLRIGDPSRAGGGMFPLCYGHGVILNTVPARVLDRELLLRMEKGTILIDLASAPFGVLDEDVRAATDAGGLRYVRLPSLPGTYAPRDAGYAIADSMLRTLRKTHRSPENGCTKGGETS